MTGPNASPADASSVLIVEDNETTRGRMAHLLRRVGYEVSHAADGLDALQKVSARPFDAIVLDLLLPHLDGWRFRAIQLRHPELALIPTIVVTVRRLREPDRYALRVTEVVDKPFEDTALIQAVQRACRMRRAVAPPVEAVIRGLLWSCRGEVACTTHAPDPASPRWREERWAPVVLAGSNIRRVYQCQHCAGAGSAINRSERGRGPQRSTSPHRRADGN